MRDLDLNRLLNGKLQAIWADQLPKCTDCPSTECIDIGNGLRSRRVTAKIDDSWTESKYSVEATDINSCPFKK